MGDKSIEIISNKKQKSRKELILSDYDYSDDVVVINDELNEISSDQNDIEFNLAIKESMLHNISKYSYNMNDSNDDYDINNAIENSLNDELIRKDYTSNLTKLKPLYMRNMIPIPHEIAGQVVGEKYRHIIPILENYCNGNDLNNKVYYIKGTNILCIESHQDYLDILTEQISLRIIDVQLRNDGHHKKLNLTKVIIK